ncbi:Calcium-dependent protease precursor [Stieleria maiorica]|uniref:Calcium-dependent protease n=1 Tax=Stieleria maiorica TaxID=2795974 RepID=A0A5B9MCQ5_9BACT|nr:S8 family serine peptidase [Stieleria maiorica]QEF98299.1 Calcium-dependent protease precursor [Stieleria maiorica]
MPVVTYGGSDEEGFELVESRELIAIRTRSNRSLRTKSTVSDPVEGQLSGCELVMRFPEAGVEVYRVPKGEKKSAMQNRKRALRQHPDVRFAGGVLIDKDAQEPVIYTENLFIKFIDSLDAGECERIIREASLILKEKLGFGINSYFVQATEGTGQRVFDLALELLARPEVQYCHPELVRPRDRKSIGSQQWHLGPVTHNGLSVSNHAHVLIAHELTRGDGVMIAVIDDGFDIDHAEFSSPGKIVAPFDAVSQTSDPRPRDPDPDYPDDHGTACAGVACASGIDGAIGVAPEARLMPIRLMANLGSMAEAKAFQWAADHGADVISCSWGPADGPWYLPNHSLHDRVHHLPTSTRMAIDYALSTGRGGLGTPVLFAAGNGNESVENDGYASYEPVIAVAACNDRGTRSVYSDYGPSIWCCFPSNDFEFVAEQHPAPITPGIWTTDRSGVHGYNPGSPHAGDAIGNYTNSFGGTSSACPGVAGVVALMLSANPDLTPLEIKDLLRRSSDAVDPEGGQYDADGHSESYGYGRVNARRAVELAVPTPAPRLEIVRDFYTSIPDRGTANVAIEIQDPGSIESIDVLFDIEHSYVGDLVVTLKPPRGAGSKVVLHDRQGTSASGISKYCRMQATPGLSRLAGKKCRGNWTLEVEDQAVRDVGTIVRFGMVITLQSTAQPGALARVSKRNTTRLVRRPVSLARRQRGYGS